MNPNRTPERALALDVLREVVLQGRSLSGQWHSPRARAHDPTQIALAREIATGVVRYLVQLDALIGELMDRPLKPRDRDIGVLIAMGIYQLRFMRTAPHAAVSETVSLTEHLGKSWARGLVNAVLRRYIREHVPDSATQSAPALPSHLAQKLSVRYAHPAWLVEMLSAAWPERLEQILEQNNERAPMTLRVNRTRIDRETYLQRLEAAGIETRPVSPAGLPDAITLANPVALHTLPEFAQGNISVQDGAAQLCVRLLNMKKGMRILDTCAAPGGKSAHILEHLGNEAHLLALDVDQQRLQQVEQTLTRLGLTARLAQADATRLDTWWTGEAYDRILVDAPCSGTGVIRRHPDIKLNRRPQDIASLNRTQRALLESAWTVLARGGLLLYATCSVLPAENERLVSGFLADHEDAQLLVIEEGWGYPTGTGRQILPGEEGMDGFFYARLLKTDAAALCASPVSSPV